MSPVYDCISKEGILSGYTPEELRAAGKERIIDTKVMALGGITPDNILEIKDFVSDLELFLIYRTQQL